MARRVVARAGPSPDRVRAWLEASCAAQGVPVVVTDALVLARVAEVIWRLFGVDCTLNAMINPVYVMAMGALVSLPRPLPASRAPVRVAEPALQA